MIRLGLTVFSNDTVSSFFSGRQFLILSKFLSYVVIFKTLGTSNENFAKLRIIRYVTWIHAICKDMYIKYWPKSFDVFDRFAFSQRARGAIIMLLLRQNDVATSFWRNNDVIITSCVRWVGSVHELWKYTLLKMFKGTVMILLRCVHWVNLIIFANLLKQLCRAFYQIIV